MMKGNGKRHTVWICDHYRNSEGGSVSVPIGELWTEPMTGTILFKYFASYLRLDDAVSVDPVNLPLSGHTKNLGRKGSSAIRDCGPDLWGRIVIDEAEANPGFGELDYITYPNPGRLGNLDFDLEKKRPGSVLEIRNLDKIRNIFEIIEKKHELSSNESVFLHMYGISLGGSRPKCTVIDENGALWLAKLPSMKDRLSEMGIEAGVMELARLCGIETCDFAFRNGILLLKRFDRRADGSRISFMSGHSLLGMGKGDDDDLKDYRLLVRQLRRLGGTADSPELFRRMMFNVLIRNIDDHVRNHGFLIEDGKARISPAYDLTVHDVDMDMSKPAMMAMKIGIRGVWGDLGNIMTSMRDFGVNSDFARTLWKDMTCVIGRNWRQAFAKYGVSDLGKNSKIFLHMEKEAKKCGKNTAMRM